MALARASGGRSRCRNCPDGSVQVALIEKRNSMSDVERPASAPVPASEFARQAAEAPPGLVREFIDFLRHNKAWWLTPIILVLLLVGVALLVGGSAPFIYTIF